MKLHKISEITQTLPFTEFDFMQKYREGFKKSELGLIFEKLPLREMAASIKSKMPVQTNRGRKPMFSPEGEVALMFLKMYVGMSDDALVEMLNGNINMQIFCGVLIDPAHPIRDGKIVSAIRNRLAPYLDIKAMQRILYEKWAPELKDKDLCLTDATCYESLLRFPTDIKLLWEACEWFYPILTGHYKVFGERKPRTKYDDVNRARLAYARQRKPKYSATRSLRRRLLHLLGKLLEQWNRLCRLTGGLCVLRPDREYRLMVIRQLYGQQRLLFEGKHVEHRIVSIDRPYIRPIVRGKENKRVEFGAKVNNIQIDGISFMEHHSFEAFNEGIRLKECVEYQRQLTGTEVKRIGADSIYANNENRRYCTEKGFITNFARKGPKPKEDDVDLGTSRRIIGTLRATVMEGSFGNQKQHYSVGRIAARNRYSETLLLFFGIHMANAATLVARDIARKKELERRARRA